MQFFRDKTMLLRSWGTGSAHQYSFRKKEYTQSMTADTKNARNILKQGSYRFCMNNCTCKALSGKIHCFATHCSFYLKC